MTVSLFFGSLHGPVRRQCQSDASSSLTTALSSLIPQIRVSRNKQRAVLLVDGRYTKQMISPKKVRDLS